MWATETVSVCLSRVAAVSWWRLTWTWPTQSSSSSTLCTAAWSHPVIATKACFWSTVWTEESTGTSWLRSSTICTPNLGSLLAYTPFETNDWDLLSLCLPFFLLFSGLWMCCCPLLLAKRECVCAGGSHSMTGLTTVIGLWIMSSSQAQTLEHRYLIHLEGWRYPIMSDLPPMAPQEE